MPEISGRAIVHAALVLGGTTDRSPDEGLERTAKVAISEARDLTEGLGLAS